MTLLKTFPTLNLEVLKAKEHHLMTTNKVYTDMQSGIWCTLLGHQPNFMKKVIREQLDRTLHLHSQWTPSVTQDLIQVLNEKTGLNGQGIFLSSGSEAVALAIRIANLKGTRKLTFKNAYLSAFDYLQSRDTSWYEIDYIPCLTCHQKCSRTCDVLNYPLESIDTFVLESFSSMGYGPPKKMMAVLLKHLKKDTTIIANEVTTGIGRTGKWFGYQHYEITPHIVTMGKGLGNGYPISCVLVNQTLAAHVNFKYIQSHQNDPLGCHIALNVIKEITAIEGLEKVSRLYECFKTHLPVKFSGIGLLFSLSFDSKEIATQVFEALLKAGYFTGHYDRFIHLAPSLTLTNQEVIYFCTTLERIIHEITDH